MSDKAAERAEFEVLAVERKWLHPLHGLIHMDHGGYLDNYLHMRWEAWQAGLSSLENARLMEARVKMHRVLERTTDYLQGIHDGAHTCEDTDCEGCKMVKQARAALRGVTNG